MFSSAVRKGKCEPLTTSRKSFPVEIEILLPLYKALDGEGRCVCTHLEFCVQFWLPTFKVQELKVEQVQNIQGTSRPIQHEGQVQTF